MTESPVVEAVLLLPDPVLNLALPLNPLLEVPQNAIRPRREKNRLYTPSLFSARGGQVVPPRLCPEERGSPHTIDCINHLLERSAFERYPPASPGIGGASRGGCGYPLVARPQRAHRRALPRGNFSAQSDRRQGALAPARVRRAVLVRVRPLTPAPMPPPPGPLLQPQAPGAELPSPAAPEPSCPPGSALSL